MLFFNGLVGFETLDEILEFELSTIQLDERLFLFVVSEMLLDMAELKGLFLELKVDEGVHEVDVLHDVGPGSILGMGDLGETVDLVRGPEGF